MLRGDAAAGGPVSCVTQKYGDMCRWTPEFLPLEAYGSDSQRKLPKQKANLIFKRQDSQFSRNFNFLFLGEISRAKIFFLFSFRCISLVKEGVSKHML
ncbi:hypothetical protein Nepgr_031604 [Nepenthes gracilis]|uniref:Uncharacterized protein n=1 Tax=Nepenthes gracilis TaxID=150966 RepID=A0AAD3Y7N4_NEPGR|nr:hypothetical protein Nepgr_031604 [Nepenthes gracilis]